MDSTLLSLGLALATAIVVALTVARVIRATTGSKGRVVEKPNSHYTAPSAVESATRERWSEIALDRLHEINREEVVRLLARSAASGVATLSTKERTFLDHMAELAGVAQEKKRPERARPGPDLRERPA